MNKPRDAVKRMNLEQELEKEPWHRLDGESDKAYGAFQAYLQLGMGNRTYAAATEKLGKSRNYEAVLRGWARKYQWGARVQAFDATQLEKQLEDAEAARLKVFVRAFTIGNFFLNRIAEDLERSWLGEWVNPDTGLKEKYTPNKAFTVDQKLKLLNWAYDMAVKNAAAQKLMLTELGSKALEGSAFDVAVDEVLYEDPKLQDAYAELLGKALNRAYSGNKLKKNFSRP